MAMVAVPYLEVAPAPAPLGAIGQAIAEDLAADVLLALVDGELAWSSFEALAVAMGRGDDAARVAVRAAESLGWIVYWSECPQEPSYTLTPAAADRLGVAIGPDGRWHRATDDAANGNYSRPGKVRRADAEEDDEPGGWLRHQIDPRAVDPSFSAENAEELGAMMHNPYVRRLLGGTAAPTVILGLRLPWPILGDDGRPLAPTGDVRPCCGVGPLPVQAVCLWCGRSGIDPALGGRGR
jgi:hypothetical protein